MTQTPERASKATTLAPLRTTTWHCAVPGCLQFTARTAARAIRDGWNLFVGRCPKHAHVPRCPPVVPRPDPQLYSVHMLAYRTEAKGKEA